jgi:hypothetical protein
MIIIKKTKQINKNYNFKASAVSQEEPVINLETLEKAALEYKTQSEKKLEIRKSREN